MIVAINRWVPIAEFEAAAERSQPLAAAEAGTSVAPRIGGLMELTRRVSGLVAIAVLGATMVALALRADEGAVTSQPAGFIAAAAAVNPEAPAPAAASTSLFHRGQSSSMTMTFYIFDTEAQRDMVLYVESMAAMEGEPDIVRDRDYKLLDAGTPEGELQARNAIYEAMLTAGSNTRIIVEDVRHH